MAELPVLIHEDDEMTKTWVKNALIALLSVSALAVAYQIGIYSAPVSIKTVIQLAAQNSQSCPVIAPIAAQHRAVARHKRHKHHIHRNYACVASGAI